MNRFLARVRLDHESVPVHLANSGRLRELLTEGRRVYVRPVVSATRKTGYDLVLVDYCGVLVSVDARLPNLLVEEAVREGRIPPLRGYEGIRREIRWGDVRLDLALSGEGQRCLVEAKSVTLVREGLALFPDAPTSRGQRHIEALRRAIAQGERAAIVFVVQRADAKAFAPNDEADPPFGRALRKAARDGVEALAYGCQVTPCEVRIVDRLAIRFGGEPA